MSSSSAAAGTSTNRAAAFFGALGVVAIPAGIVAAQYLNGVPLLHALYVAVPAAALCGAIAVAAARRARYLRARSISAAPGGRAARLLAWAALYAGVTGGIALGVYAVLHYAQ